MIKQSLTIKNADGTTFPTGKVPAVIGTFTYTAQRMGNAPTLTATLNYPFCLDEYWTGQEYVEFKGSKFYLNRTPASSKDNSSFNYKHELSFADFRTALNNVFFLDVVSDNTEAQYADRYRSNTTKFTFMGTAREFAARINDSMEYSGLCTKVTDGWTGFRIVFDGVDDTDAVEVSFEETYIADAIQMFFDEYELNYYWIGQTCHIGDFQTMFTTPLEYQKGLLSISLSDTNNKLFNRITGCGSSENIPYYYPNDNAEGEAIISVSNIDEDKVSVDLQKMLAYNPLAKSSTYKLYKYATTSLTKKIGSTGHNPIGLLSYGEVMAMDFTLGTYVINTDCFVYNYKVGYAFIAYLPKYANISIDNITAKVDTKGIIDVKALLGEAQWAMLKTKALIGAKGDIPNAYENLTITNQSIKGTIRSYQTDEYPENEFCHNIDIIMDGWYYIQVYVDLEYPFPYSIENYKETGTAISKRINAELSGDIEINYAPDETYVFKYGTDDFVGYSDSGITIDGLSSLTPIQTEFTIDETEDGKYKFALANITQTDDQVEISIGIKGSKYITPCTNLMPSIYRNSLGEQRFYDAVNGGYKKTFDGTEYDYTGFYDGITFANEFSGSNIHEGKQDFDDIKPTIVGVKNGNGYLFGEIADIAFDKNNNDTLVEGSSDDSENYLHSYFYIKLHVFNGTYGFNLFKQALESDTAKIQMTSGDCAACSFEIAVEKEQNGTSYDFYNPVVTDDDGNLVHFNNSNDSGFLGDCIAPISRRSMWVSRQQDTTSYEVWIAVKKENETFGVVMPNASHNYKPKAGDTFVITGIKMPKELVVAAEDRLSQELISYMAENNDEVKDMSVTFSRTYLREHEDFVSQLNENSIVAVKYGDKVYDMYVTSYSVKADSNILYEITVDLSLKLTASTSQSEQQLNALEARLTAMIGGAGGYSLDQIRQYMKDFFLSKVSEDDASKLINFLGGLTATYANIYGDTTVKGRIGTSDYIDSISAGKGWRIDGKGNGQLESLEVRSSLKVLELVYNRLSAEGSEYVFTESGTVDAVTKKTDGTYDLTIRRRSSTDFTDFHTKDILRGIVNDLSDLGGGQYYTIWCVVNSVDTSTNIVNVAVYGSSNPIYVKDADGNDTETIDYFETTDVPSGKNYEPQALTVFQRWGNTVAPSSETHENEEYAEFIEEKEDGTYVNTRQSCWFISSIEKRIAMLDGIDKPILEESNYAAFFGLPTDDIATFQGCTMNPLQPYLYCRGAFLQDIHYIDYKGNVMKMERYRGEWSEEQANLESTDENYDPYTITDTTYDTVYHNNCKWQCAAVNTTDEPTESSSAWVLLQKGVLGESAVVAYLSNDTTAIPCDASGNVLSTNTIKTYFYVFQGANPVQLTNLIPRIKTSGGATGLQLVCKPSTGEATITPRSTAHLTETATVISLTGTYEIDGKEYSQTLYFTITASFAGEDGESPVIYEIDIPDAVIKVKQDGSNVSYMPDALTPIVKTTVGTTITNTYIESLPEGQKMYVQYGRTADSSIDVIREEVTSNEYYLNGKNPEYYVTFTLISGDTYDYSKRLASKTLRLVYDGTTITAKEVKYAVTPEENGCDQSVLSTLSEEDWTTAIPTVDDGSYLWSRTTITYSDGESTTSYSVSRTGIDGSGIKSSIVDYYMAEEYVKPETISDDSWGEYPSSVTEGYWLYTRSRVTYSDDQTTTSYSVAKIGTGSYYAGVSEYYALGSSSSIVPGTGDDGTNNTYPTAGAHTKDETLTIISPWSVVHPTEDDTKPENNGGVYKPYLWNFEVSRDSDGNKYVTAPVCIGNYAKGIVSMVETYAISSESVLSDTVKALTWTDEQMDAAPTEEKPYQWNKTVTTYTNGTTDTSYHVSAVRGNDAPLLSISSTRQIVACDKSRVPLDDSNIVITATLQNISGDITWKVYADGADCDKSWYTANGGTLTITGVAAFAAANNSLKVVATLGTLSDTITIGRVDNGATGADAYTVLLSNENHTFAANADGTAIVGTTSTNIIAYKGATQIPVVISSVTDVPDGMTATISNNETRNAAIEFSVDGNMTTKSGDISIKLLVDGEDFTKQFSYALSEKGGKGDKGDKGDDGIDGVDGADGTQPNLYGYDCTFGGNIISVAHTSTGFAAIMKGSGYYNSQIYHYKNDSSNRYDIGTYALSCKIKITAISGMPDSFKLAAGADYIARITKENCVCGTEYEFSFKGSATRTTVPWIDLGDYSNSESGITSSSIFLLEAYDWKFEDAKYLRGTHTPFDGLAADNIVVGTNLLKGSKKFSDWTTGTKSDNAYQGCTAAANLASSTTDWQTIAQLAVDDLKRNTWYTLSWYEKATATGATLLSQISDVSDYADYTSVIVCNTDGAVPGTPYCGYPKMTHEVPTEWEYHTMTFYLSTTTSVIVQLMAKGGLISIAMPKLEEGQKPTMWRTNEADDRGAIMRGPTEWKAGVHYFSGAEGEPYQDMVTYPDYSTQVFLCKFSHDSVEGETPGTDGNQPDDATTKRTSGWDSLHPWVVSDVQEFVATKVLFAEKAKIENLYTDELITGDSGARTEISGSTFNIYGTGDYPGITVEVDEDGNPHLVFNDTYGNKLYDLGPSGITNITKTNSYFENIGMFVGSLSNTYQQVQNIDQVASASTSSKYKFHEGYTYTGSATIYLISGTSTPDSDFNGLTYMTNAYSGDLSNDGYPTGTKMNGIFAQPTTNQWGVSSEGNPIYEIDFYVYSAGKLQKKVTVYWSNNSDGIWIHRQGAGTPRAVKDANGDDITKTTNVLLCDRGDVKSSTE